MENKIRHILGLSGGKDSTALVVLLKDKIPQMEYFFCDTGKELPETYEYLSKIEARFGITIERLSPRQDFDFWLDRGGGFLPSPKQRWCTVNLKIKPLEKFVGTDIAYSYIGIREDEDRSGYLSAKTNIKPVYAFKSRNFKTHDKQGGIIYEQSRIVEELKKQNIDLPINRTGYTIDDLKDLLSESGIGLPDYYQWRSRSGCYFCFFQRKYEWIMLAQKHPDLFEKAVKYERGHADTRNFTWNESESLRDILERVQHKKVAAVKPLHSRHPGYH